MESRIPLGVGLGVAWPRGRGVGGVGIDDGEGVAHTFACGKAVRVGAKDCSTDFGGSGWDREKLASIIDIIDVAKTVFRISQLTKGFKYFCGVGFGPWHDFGFFQFFIVIDFTFTTSIIGCMATIMVMLVEITARIVNVAAMNVVRCRDVSTASKLTIKVHT